ncbi:MAG: DEAD/DEAH box helicase [Acidimicrobiia bacterium]|nr:DEAD/DEAH box helicase [Acidimicrobiia bacterium]
MALLSDPPLDAVVTELADDGRLVHTEYLAPQPARHQALAQPLPPEVAERGGAQQLWTHQAQAIDLIRQGRSVVVVTGTASGKSRCYQLPIAEAVADPIRPATALALFPTKALAHDQLRALAAPDYPGLVAATYDGDDDRERRAWVRANANVVLTNPEMLHAGVLPHHSRWGDFLMRLRYVVIDELHVLRGVFGTHVAHVLRRLQRVAAQYGADPSFVFTSATIGEPSVLARGLCGRPVVEVADDGSPQGSRTVALLNPPVVDPDTGARTSSNAETASAAARLIAGGHRTIVFCRSRKGTELVAADIARRLPADLGRRVRPYRAGYLAEERREIEHQLHTGALRGIVATSALELGVDIGGLDACVLNGFPGTIASFWQQIGRVGRHGDHSTAVLVAGDDQLDQWLMAHPHELFSRRPEPAVVNVANPQVARPHVACAAFEHPLSHGDDRWWGDEVLHDAVRDLVVDDQLRLRRGRWPGDGPRAVWATRGFPSRGIGLRSGTAGEFTIAAGDGTRVGTVDITRAFEMVHPGAVYLHQGRHYEVVDLDVEQRLATVEPASGDTYTQPRSTIDISVSQVHRIRRLGRAQLFLGTVEVASQVTGYQRREVRSRRILDNHQLELPPSRLSTTAFWYVIDADAITDAAVPPADVPGTLHAIEHAAIGMLPLFTICDRWDVGGVSIAHHPDTGGPTVFVHDAYPGGTGIAPLGFDAADRHLAATRAAIHHCVCRDGCPSCVQSPKCGNGNEPLDKHGAIRLLEVLLAPGRAHSEACQTGAAPAQPS